MATTSRKKQPAQSPILASAQNPLFEKYRHYDVELEEGILGIIMLCSLTGMAKVRRILQPEFFYHDFNKILYEVLVKMYDSGLPIDYFTVRSWIYANLPKNHDIWTFHQSTPIDLRLSRCTHAVCQDNHLQYWAYLIRNQYIERCILVLTTQGVGEGMTAREKMIEIQKKMDELSQFQQGDRWLSMTDVLLKLYQWMKEVEGLDIVGVPTGFSRVDNITGGFSYGGLHYLAARPSVGKTALALKMILNQAQMGLPVGIISLEMPDVQLGARALSMVSGQDFWRIHRGKLDEADHQQLYTYAQALAGLPVYVSDQPAVTLSDIRGQLFKLIHEKGCKALWIDYLQLVSAEESYSREQEVANLSRGLKLLAMQCNIPIIALAQLNRESEKRSNKKPQLSDLRESGSIEQDADGVMLLHRDWQAGIEKHEDGFSTEFEADLIIAKWRNGQTFNQKLDWQGKRMEFKEQSTFAAA